MRDLSRSALSTCIRNVECVSRPLRLRRGNMITTSSGTFPTRGSIPSKYGPPRSPTAKEPPVYRVRIPRVRALSSSREARAIDAVRFLLRATSASRSFAPHFPSARFPNAHAFVRRGWKKRWNFFIYFLSQEAIDTFVVVLGTFARKQLTRRPPPR